MRFGRGAQPEESRKDTKAMKRIGNTFGQIIALENIMQAHRNARRGKLYNKGVQLVDGDVEKHCTEIQAMLVNKTYSTSTYHEFEICDRGKSRNICELPYHPDRVIQWALLQVVEPVFCKHFISATYAAIPKKGTHAALRKLQDFMKDHEGTKYCLKFDVKKFFPHVNKEILKAQLRKKFKCKDTLWLLDDIVESYHNGIPIGNYTSQYFGNFYLSWFDHWVKEVLKVKYYIRYMDDLVILHHSKEYLHDLRKTLNDYLESELKLTIKENWQVFPTFIRGVDFVGYRHFGDYTLLRKGTKKRLKGAVKKLILKQQKNEPLTKNDQSVVGSYFGILKWGDCYRLKAVTIDKIKKMEEKKHDHNSRNTKRKAVTC